MGNSGLVVYIQSLRALRRAIPGTSLGAKWHRIWNRGAWGAKEQGAWMAGYKWHGFWWILVDLGWILVDFGGCFVDFGGLRWISVDFGGLLVDFG